MTMPSSARNLIVDNEKYKYMLKFGSRRFRGQTPSEVDLVVQLSAKIFLRATFKSKLWTTDHEDDIAGTPVHKNTFSPKDVAAAIRAQRGGKLPPDFDLENWKLTRDPQRVR